MTGNARGFLIGLGAVAVAGWIGWAAMQPNGPKKAPASAATVARPTGDLELVSVPRTNLAAAREAIERGSVTVIDVRDADSYVAGHLPGSLQIPLMRIEGEVNYLPRDKPILTYCT